MHTDSIATNTNSIASITTESSNILLLEIFGVNPYEAHDVFEATRDPFRGLILV
jgi:hypothetical protein